MSTPRPTKLRVSYRSDRHPEWDVYDTMLLSDAPEYDWELLSKTLAFVEHFLQEQGLQFEITFTGRTEREEVLDALREIQATSYFSHDHIKLVESYVLKQIDTP